jgi:plastocyanin
MRFFSGRRVDVRHRRAAALVLAAVLSAGSSGVRAAPGSPLRTVAIDAMRFSPQTMEVQVGDTVEWNNKDPFPHTATAGGQGFDSGEIPAGGSWKWTAREKGIFPYRCALHPTMQGTLVVK